MEGLSELEVDILEMETAAFASDSTKLNMLKDKHPTVSPTRYTVLLLGLLNNRMAWEHDNERFAPTLARIQRLHQQRVAERGAARGVAAEQ